MCDRLKMTAGTEVVSNDVIRKVEIDDNCGGADGLDLSDLDAVGAVDCNGGGGGGGGGNGKDDSDDSSYVFVNESVEVTADTGGADVNVIIPKSDSADEVEQVKKEGLGLENGGTPAAADSLVLETNGDATLGDVEVQAVKEGGYPENGSTVDSSLVLETNGEVLESVNSQQGQIIGEDGAIATRTDEVEEVNVIGSVKAETDDIDPGVKDDSELTLNPMESSQMTVCESESTPKIIENSKPQVTITQSGSTPEVINIVDVSHSTPNPITITDSQITHSTPNPITITDSEITHSTPNPITITDSQITHSTPDPVAIADSEITHSAPNPVTITDSEITVNGGSESVSNLVDKAECQVTVDGSDSAGKPTEVVECRETTDGSESSAIPFDKQGCQVSVDGSESIGNPVDNQICPVSVDGSKSTGNCTENTESRVTDLESGGKLEECQEFMGEAKPNHVCDGIKVEHQSESVSAPHPFENKKAEGVEIGSKENPGTVVGSSEAADAPINAEEEKLEGIEELGEIQMSQTEADERGLLEVDSEKAKPEEQVEKQVEGSSVSIVKYTDSVELEAEIEETKKEQVEIVDENKESQIVVIDNVHNDLHLEGDAAVQSADEAEAPLGTETTSEQIIEDNAAPRHEETSSCVDETQTGIQVKESAENVNVLLSTDTVNSECKNGEVLFEKDKDPLSTPDDVTSVEQRGECGTNLITENHSAEDVDCSTEIENLDAPDDEQTKIEVKDAPVRDHSTLSFPDTYVSPGTVIEFGSIGHHEKVSSMHNDSVITVPEVLNRETEPACGANSDSPEEKFCGSQVNKVTCQEVEDLDGIQSDGVPTSSVEGSVSDAIDGQNEEAEIPPYNFLIRIPRYEDEMLRDQIKNAQLQVDEKTRLRDAIRAEIHVKRSKLKAHNEAFNAAKLEETAARRLVRLKRQEIDSVQVVINRVKNAISVEDIDGRIYNMEHMIQHETLCLKDEKQFIREIKQLKNLRDQLASNMGSQDEVQQALDQKDQIEERLKVLRKELDSLKDKVSKAEAAAIAVGKKYDEESRRERELQAQFRAADEVRQKAYAHLNSLKRQSYDKNKDFRLYKEDVMAARDFASRGDKDSLHRLCANQVETFMEQWNSNDEFRKEYVGRCNMNASRRQRTLDERSLGLDEVSPVLPNNAIGRVDTSLVSIPGEVKTFAEVSAVEHGNLVSSVEKNIENKTTENVSQEKNQAVKTKDLVKPTLGSEIATITGRDEAIDNNEEEMKTLTREEIELARKEEESRKEETEAQLKEQRRLEEKAKAIEALERKKRNAEKAQMRAELRARKEAEQKEKEREKRLRKKEKKRASGDGSVNGEDAANSESSNEAITKESESVKDKENGGSLARKKPQKPPPHFFSNSKQLKPKSVPPPLASRNKKRWQQWGKVIAAAAAILALFLLGNTGFFLNLKQLKTNGSI